MLQSHDFVQVSYRMQVEGSTNLPDPAPLNAFLKGNTTLVNPLFASHPPLQLQVCNASILNRPAFSFYTVQHAGGCDSEPGLASNPKQEKAVSRYDTIILLWDSALLVLFCLYGAGWCLSERVRVSTDKFWNGDRRLEAEMWRPPSYRRERKWSFDDVVAALLLGSLVCLTFGVLAYLLYTCNLGLKHLEVVPLPDPSDLNNVLASNGHNVTLHLCSVRDVFQVYIGFSKGCDQLRLILYPGVYFPYDNPMVHEPFVVTLMIIASAIAYLSWVVLAWAILYGCYSIWNSRESVGELFSTGGQEKCGIDMEAPSGSSAKIFPLEL